MSDQLKPTPTLNLAKALRVIAGDLSGNGALERERAGCASPYEKLKLSYLEKQLAICDRMLTEQGVPEWVILADSNGVPSNSVPLRLKWYLARRKDVASGEIDQQLQDMMEESLKLSRARHNNGSNNED